MTTAEQVFYMSMGAGVASLILAVVAVVAYLVEGYLLTQPEGDTAPGHWELSGRPPAWAMEKARREMEWDRAGTGPRSDGLMRSET